ncbi:MAG: TonB-dependent receptor [Bacteroidales bacterium]|nr:TonB-dependent receptor [Bacteroidales bacterium]
MRIAVDRIALAAAVLLCTFFPTVVNAQNCSVSGRVVDDSGVPLELAIISLNGTIHAVSDKNGNYSLHNLKPAEYSWTASFVGFDEASGKIVVNGNTRLDITLNELSLQLESVSVTAEHSDLGSKSTIREEAIRHIQPKSITDLLQLVPGSLTRNPNLNALSQASIREIDEGDGNNALGTAVVVDGAPIGNDAGLQALSVTRNGTDSSTNSDGMNDQTTAGKGVDLRTVSAGNIESVEVISGIPSVEYGNLTSGVIVVKTKAGQTPWEIKASADPSSKQIFMGKGFRLRSGGAFNFSGDWSQSWSDPRRRYLGYERLTAGAGWSRVIGPLSINVRGSFYSNINTRKTDPQFLEDHVQYSNSNTGGRLSVNGRLNFKKGILTALDYNLSASAAKTVDWHHSLISSPPGAITDARESGVAEAIVKKAAYYSEYTIEGVPIDVFAQVTADKYIQLRAKDYTRLKLGAEYKLSANRGAGLVFDILNPPSASSSKTLRPRSYADIPALNQFSLFASDKTSLTLGPTVLKLEAGARAGWLPLDSSKSGGNEGYKVLEPRINLSWTVLKDSFLDELTLKGGYGISNKMPTLLNLYPDNVYIDIASLNYGGSAGDYYAVMTTNVLSDTKNPSLKPATSYKWEAGLSFRKGKADGYVTLFRENHIHEFGFNSQLLWTPYEIYTLPTGASAPHYDPATGDVTYTDSGGNPAVATRSSQVLMTTWGLPDNTTRSLKYGVEYGLNLGTLKALHTSLSINGAYFHIRRFSERQNLNYVQSNYDYVGVMPSGSGSVRERFNTSFRFITHIPAVRMIFTTTLQAVWYESRQTIWEDEAGNHRYTPFSSGGSDWLAVDPVGYYSRDGSYSEWTAADRTSTVKQRMMQRYYLVSFEKDVTEPWFMLNIRFTKEIGSIAELSFTANNVTNSSRYHTGKYIYTKTQLYPDIYFGAELKIKL